MSWKEHKIWGSANLGVYPNFILISRVSLDKSFAISEPPYTKKATMTVPSLLSGQRGESGKLKMPSILFHVKLNMQLAYDPAIQTHRGYPKEIKTCVYTKTYVQILMSFIGNNFN